MQHMIPFRHSAVRIWVAVLATFVFIGCAASPPETTSPTAEPHTTSSTPATAPVTPSVITDIAPTAEPSSLPPAVTTPLTPTAILPAPTGESTPTTALTLPAPLYALVGGQIVRVAADGSNAAPMTAEEGQITGFDYSRETGSLTYIVEPPTLASPNDRALIYNDMSGDERREIFTAAMEIPHFAGIDEEIRGFDPESDGHQIVYRVTQQVPDIPPERAGPGLFQSLDIGMCPYVLQTDIPPSEPNGPRTYAPVVASPSGLDLLIEVSAERTTLAIQKRDGTLIPLTAADGTHLQAGGAAWSADSMAVYVANETGIWRANAVTGIGEVLLPSNEQMHHFSHPHVSADGQVYFFAQGEGESGENTAAPYLLDAQGLPQRLRSESYAVEEVLWADDGRGVVVVEAASQAHRALWVPTNTNAILTAPVVEIAALNRQEGGLGTELRWAVEPAPAASPTVGSAEE